MSNLYQQINELYGRFKNTSNLEDSMKLNDDLMYFASELIEILNDKQNLMDGGFI